MRFFHEFDKVRAFESINSFHKHHHHEEWCPSLATAKRWVKRRQLFVENGFHSPERRHTELRNSGRPRKDVDSQIELMATGPELLRKKDYEYHQSAAGVSYQTLRRRMRERDPPVIRSKRRPTGALSQKNKEVRKSYGHKHLRESVDSLWQYILFTDEAHADRAMAIEQWIFREQGNEQGLYYEQPLLDKLQLHFAASVSWHHKSKLTFYHDEH